MRYVLRILSVIGLITLVHLASAEDAAPEPKTKPEAPAEAGSKESPASAREHEASTKPCKKRDQVVSVWNELVANGCKVSAAEGVPPTALRLLRNVPFAMRGHPFSSPELRTFFEEQRDACGHHWYRPGSEKVRLPAGPERRCARRLAKAERALRKRYPLPPKMEAFLIENLGTDLLSLVPVLEGKTGRYGVSSSVERTDAEWRVTLYEVLPGDDETGGDDVESAVTADCKADGTDCEVFVAG